MGARLRVCASVEQRESRRGRGAADGEGRFTARGNGRIRASKCPVQGTWQWSSRNPHDFDLGDFREVVGVDES